MTRASAFICTALIGLLASLPAAAEGRAITDKASATEAARRFLKTRCTDDLPCKFKPERDGKQWRVWVQTTRRASPNQAPKPYPGGTLVLYFDANGTLTRRLEAD